MSNKVSLTVGTVIWRGWTAVRIGRALHSPGIMLDPDGDAGRHGQMDEEGERSWAVTIVVLEEDLG